MAQVTCTPVNYWVGSTTERFKISDTDIFETSDITITPNYGTGIGPELDFTWIFTNFNVVNKLSFRGAKHHVMDVLAGEAHALIIVPTTIAVTNIGETVFSQNVGMTQGLHYDVFTLVNSGQNYNAYYLRDLTSFVFPKRQFQFDVSIA